MKARRQRKQVEATGGVEETEAKFIPEESYGVEKESKRELNGYIIHSQTCTVENLPPDD